MNSRHRKIGTNDTRIPFTEDDIERLFKKTDEDGKNYTTIPLHAPGETTNGHTGKEWRGNAVNMNF